MKPDPKSILSDAMKLDIRTRALVAEALLASLDSGEDFPVSPEWLEEIARRCDEIDNGRVSLLDGDSVMSELRKKYA